MDLSGLVHQDYRDPLQHLPTVNAKKFIIPGNDMASMAEMAEASAYLDQYRIRLARENFGVFMEYCFYDERTRVPFRQQWFHDEWSETWDTKNRVLIIAPRDHGKTSQIVGRVIWELGRNQNLRIKIACATDGRAKERLFEVVQHIEYNIRLHRVFPDLVQDKNAEWSKHRIIVKRTARHRDASVEALGITATATGGRCDLLIADDVVDRRNALSFPKLRTQIKQAWKSDWTNLLEPDSRIWYICTLWHKDDLSHELIENPAFTTMFYAIPPDFGAMWPEKWHESALRARYAEIGSVEFNRGFRNQALDEDAGIVNPRWLQYRDLEHDETFVERLPYMQLFTSYDTAVAVNAGADYSANTTIAVDPDERMVYVLNAWHARLSVVKQVQEVRRAYLHYRPFRVLIEKVGQAVLDEWVINEYPDMASVIEVTRPTVSKQQRLLAVTPLMEQGRVIFSDTLDPDGEKWDPRNGSLVNELLDFPFGKNDDIVDSYSQGLMAARRYFLDDWAAGSDNGIDVRVGSSGSDDRYLY